MKIKHIAISAGIACSAIAVGVTMTGAGGPRILPDMTMTPGVTNPDITQNNIADNICNPSWSTKSIRPPVSYTTPLKIKQITEYGYTDTATKDYEEDHLISLELGGSPTDPKNLWPEAYNTIPGARQKDLVENYLHKQVCAGTMSLSEAQKEISTDWTAVYKEMNHIMILGNVEAAYLDQDDD